jgi:hypothetical protein
MKSTNGWSDLGYALAAFPILLVCGFGEPLEEPRLMLEHSSIWLSPWASSAGQRPVTTRTILDPATRSFLGLARCSHQSATVWFGYMARPTVEVFETEDESLLFTITRTWGLGTGWVVCDADGHRIGTLRSNLVRDQRGRQLATLEPSAPGTPRRWLAPDGQELGTIAVAGEGLLATFSMAIADNPFVKMLLLATLLRAVDN